MILRSRKCWIEILESRYVAAADPFTIAVLPDTQFYSESFPSIFNAQTDWIVAQRQARNIVFATQLGDLVQNGERGADRNLAEWQRADAAMDRLDGNLASTPDGVLPYTALIGNHDYVTVSDKTSGNARYQEFFSPTRYASRSWYLEGSANVGGHAVLFQGGGYTFLSISLQYEALDSDLQWAQEIMDAYPGIPTLLLTHSYLNPSSLQRQKTIQGNNAGTPNAGNSGESLFQNFVFNHPQIFLVMNGHFSGEHHQVSTNIAGQSVVEMVMDYQSRTNGGDGWMRLLEFDLQAGKIQARTYSPTLSAFETDANSEFEIQLDFQKRFGHPSPSGIREWQFQQGRIVNGSIYQSVVDTQLRQAAPTTNYGSSSTDLLVDAATAGQNNTSQALLRFDNLFGSLPSQIPNGAQILEATLVLESTNPGAGGRLHRMLVPWSAASTWSSLANGIQTDNIEARSAYEAFVGSEALTPLVPIANRLSLDVTADLQAWSSGEINRGWAFVPWTNGTDGWAFAPSESALRDARPNLVIRWMPPRGANQQPQLTRNGESATYIENGPPVFPFDGLTLLDVDSQNFQDGTVRVEVKDNGEAMDELMIVPSEGQDPIVSIVSNSILFNGTPIGQFGGGLGRSPLTINWNASATFDSISQVLRRIGFRNHSDNPSISSRKISLTAWDPLGAASQPMHSIVSIQAVDDPPSFLEFTNSLTIPTLSPTKSISLSNRIEDVDSNVVSAASLVVQWLTPVLAGDTLSVRTIGNQPNQIRTEGSTVFYGSQPIADWDASDASGLRFSWRPNVSMQAATALVQAIGLQTNFERLSPPERQLHWLLLDADEKILASSITTVRTTRLRESSFQQATDNGFAYYTGASDTQLAQATPNTAGASSESIFVDFDAGTSNTIGLLRFDAILGNGPGQIPSGSRILDAYLTLTTTNGGDGAGLYRLLVPWDESNTTWNSLPATPSNGKPIRNNGITARIVAESQVGTSAGTGDPDTGTTQIGVLDDLQAWVNGESNYGWLIQGWDLRTDGWAFASSNATTISQRPKLHVTWITPELNYQSFQQGVGGYAGARDTHVRQDTPTTNYEFSSSTLFVDAPDNGQANTSQVILRFDDLFGNGAGRIPFGSQIHAATLSLSSRLSNTPGDGGTVHRILSPLPDVITWNTLKDGFQADNLEASSVPTAEVGDFMHPMGVQSGKNQVFVTGDLQHWSYQESLNHGWVLLPFPNGTDGWGIAPSETGSINDRPGLVVSYTTPDLSAISNDENVRESGSFATVTVRMSTPPRSAVRVQVRSSDPSEANTNTTELVFTPTDWDLPKTVLVHGIEDWIRDGDQSISILFDVSESLDPIYNGLGIPSIDFTVVDDGQLNTPPALSVRDSEVQGFEDQMLSNHGTWFDPDPNDPVTLTVNIGNVVQYSDGRWEWSYFPEDNHPAQLVVVTATDSRGFSEQILFQAIALNRAPWLSVVQTSLEGSVLSHFSNSGTWDDIAADTVVLSASLGAVTKYSDGTWFWTYQPTSLLQQQTVVIRALDEDGGESQVVFKLTTVVAILATHIYYANSSFASDDTSNAIDPSKRVATSGAEARPLSYENLINAQRGINGLQFEIAGLPSLNVTTEDFVFRVSPLGTFDSNAWTPNRWEAAPVPSRLLAQSGNTNQPTILRIEWNDATLTNRWLQIQVLPTPRTGLIEKKTFYIGHLLGETTGLSQQDTYVVQVADVAKVRPDVGKAATVGSPLDINKNGMIQISDITAFRPSVGSLVLSNLTIPPRGSVAEGEGRVQKQRFVSLFSHHPKHPLRESHPNSEELSEHWALRCLTDTLVDTALSDSQINLWLSTPNQE
jgi:hypothetical protein